ncbi:ATP-binding protein [Sphingomonas sp. dw_22]|uniref:sensor histidine kinase n=1 Tax=Sphingomonas sp. dw_22 TaxID=2721175 RepID=UPI001BD46280|nr:ATP-binding protein [Sphingomonas sp. dw_22]
MKSLRRSHLAVLALVLVAVALIAWAGDRWARGRANAAADTSAVQIARTHAALLNSELQKFRLLPLVLIEYPDVAGALDGNAGSRAALDRTLELLASRTDAADIYVIGPDGVTVAASNWRKPTSFVGQNYGFRPYFRDAMRDGSAELFALGTVSRRPGLYLARRVDRGGSPLGVVVVKVEFDSVESAWGRASGASFVTDANGVILVTSLPDWRFHTIGGVDPAVIAAARRTLQYGGNPPLPAPIRLAMPRATSTSGARERFRVAAEPAPIAGGRLYHISPLDVPLAAARTQALLLGLGTLVVLGGIAIIVLRSGEKQRLQREAREALEREVERRTAELRDANAQLIIESKERAEADQRYRNAREELAQASRLGTLGQVTAGVAHEINQPVAAIRTFAESGATLIDRGAGDTARQNFAHIVELADRIGRITAELRGFARKRTRSGGAATVASVLEGVMILIGERARGIVTIGVPAEVSRLTLKGDRVRIEQILVNLLQNALDAIANQPGGKVFIDAAAMEDMVELSVEDTGPGIDAAIGDSLFTPFTTSKPGGLGLGLAIARDIAREFGGDLRHVPLAGGTRFTLKLPTA